MKQRYIIVNADDFGLSTGCNQGIIKAITQGVVSSTTLMMNMPGTQEAILLAKFHGLNCVGIHLNLSTGCPLTNTNQVPSLINQSGQMTKANFDLKLPLEQVEIEWRTQIKGFMDSGLQMTHMDSHHHIHTAPHYLPLAQKLAREFQVPLRGIPTHSSALTPEFTGGFYDEKITVENFKELVNQCQDQWLEIMVHPAYVDQGLMSISSYLGPRETELAVLTDPDLIKWCEEQAIVLSSYRDFSVRT